MTTQGTQADQDGQASSAAPAGPHTDAYDAATVVVHPHGELTSYFGRTSKVTTPIEPGMTIAALLERLGVPAKDVWVHALNGETVKPDATLSAGDSLELFSPVAGG